MSGSTDRAHVAIRDLDHARLLLEALHSELEEARDRIAQLEAENAMLRGTLGGREPVSQPASFTYGLAPNAPGNEPAKETKP